MVIVYLELLRGIYMNLPIKIQEDNKELFLALKNSVYAGANDETVALIISYCKHRNLDPMLKPVHPVNMPVKNW